MKHEIRYGAKRPNSDQILELVLAVEEHGERCESFRLIHDRRMPSDVAAIWEQGAVGDEEPEAAGFWRDAGLGVQQWVVPR